MNKTAGEVRVLRATFETVLKNQERLRKKLDALESENRPLSGDGERDDFMELLARATLGLGTKSKVRAVADGVHILGNMEEAACWLAYQDKKKVKLEGPFHSSDIEIGELWKILRDAFFKVRPFALERATSISAERIPWETQAAEKV